MPLGMLLLGVFRGLKQYSKANKVSGFAYQRR